MKFCSCPGFKAAYHLKMNKQVWWCFRGWWQTLTSSSCAPFSLISGTKSVIGPGKRGGKFFLERETSVGHSSSGGKPITLKKQLIFSETRLFWICIEAVHLFAMTVMNVMSRAKTHSRIFPSWSTSDSPQNKGLTDRRFEQNQTEADVVSLIHIQ